LSADSFSKAENIRLGACSSSSEATSVSVKRKQQPASPKGYFSPKPAKGNAIEGCC